MGIFPVFYQTVKVGKAWLALSSRVLQKDRTLKRLLSACNY